MEIETLADEELLNRLKALVRQEREDVAAVVEHMAEVDRRDLARERGYASLFEYCVKKLGYSEPSAYHRIRAARAIRKKPQLLALLRAGELHLEAIVLLHPHLDDEKSDALVEQARGKSKREVETFLAPLSPRPQPRDAIRVMAVQTKPAGDMPLFGTPPPTPASEPPQMRAQVSLSAGPILLELLGRAKDLLWHKYPEGRLEDVLVEALRALLRFRDPEFWRVPAGATQSTSRKIPKWVRRQVWRRDRGRCVYESVDGRRCASRAGLEFDHVVPWARGGTSNDPVNVRLLCRAHNQLMARRAGLERPEPDPGLRTRSFPS